MMKTSFTHLAAHFGTSLGIVILLGGCLLPGNTTTPLAQALPPTVLNRPVADGDLIRVGISDDKMTEQEYPLARLTATGSYRVTDNATGGVVFDGTGGQVITVTVDRNGFYLSGAKSAGPLSGPLTLKPKNDASLVKILDITRRGQPPSYKGHFEILKGYSSPKKLSVVNVVPIQEYLKAVVPNELPARYGFEAVKAQSVAARNYAIRPREKPWPQFDICDSQYCQVYYGAHTEHPETNRALAETHGLIALYDGDPILALYSSAHGGHSENYENAFSDPKTDQFPGTPLPYLTGKPDIPQAVSAYGDLSTEEAARAFWTAKNIPSYDVNSPHNRWERRWSQAEIQASINQYLGEASKEKFTARFITPAFKPGQSIGELKRIRVKQRGHSGKAMVVEIEASNGHWTIQKEYVIRKVFQHNHKMLPSGNVVFSHLTDGEGRLVNLVANGGGFGHGVGMSQLGASWLSGQGRPYPTIIQHYYKGVALGTIPLLVGKHHFSEPVRVSFHAPAHQGKLMIETDRPGPPVTVEINGQPFSVDANVAERSIAEADDYLKPGTLNTLVLYPDTQNPDRAIKAWIELYPPKAGEAPQRAAHKKPAEVCVLNVCW